MPSMSIIKELVWDEPWGHNAPGERTLNVRMAVTPEDAIEYMRRIDPRRKDLSDDACIEEFMTVFWASPVFKSEDWNG